MDACTQFCSGLNGLLGSFIGNLVLTGGAMLFVWLKGRTAVTKAIAPVIARAEVAEQKLNEAHIKIAGIEGSLRPSAVSASMVPPVIGTDSSKSGAFHSVQMPELDAATPKPRPSMPEPNLSNPTIPRAGALPKFTDDEKGGA